jgi:hypothetical protein
MKTALSLAILGAGLIAVSGQDVFVLGGPGTTTVPPIVYQPPVVNVPAPAYQPVQTVVAAVPVVPVAPAYAGYSYPAYSYSSGYYNPNVMYIGGPGTCGPTYYDYAPCSSPNVIYFGRTQSYREGYHFRHCR